ncbi:MAG TPA: CBS domain-containing protein [Candidatus Saccharimonadales bacterium]|nr:CBS domain-containing protein [Candidatus Saccharimonadales bacterium]
MGKLLIWKMIYLSEILNKQLYIQDKSFGKVIDFTLTDTNQAASLTKLVLKKGLKKYFVDADLVSFIDGKWIAKSHHVPLLPFDQKDFFIAEDLLDKQVIDINGKRLVRVNDIVLRQDEKFSIKAIDIGFGGVLRRLGLGNMFSIQTITLPWKFIEAFDYETGNVKISLSQSSLNNLHPAEVANILEDAGTKERLGMVHVLDAQQAASAIEEADEETQSAILEEVSGSKLKHIIENMHVSELVDVLSQVNPFTSHQILTTLSKEKASQVKKLSIFADDVAGGMMDTHFYKESGDKTLAELLKNVLLAEKKPEGIIVVDSEDKVIGVFPTESLLYLSHDTLLKDAVTQKQHVFEDTAFPKILRFFAEYNLRTLPVISESKKVIGVISIDNILARIEEEEEREDAV